MYRAGTMAACHGGSMAYAVAFVLGLLDFWEEKIMIVSNNLLAKMVNNEKKVQVSTKRTSRTKSNKSTDSKVHGEF
jgi:hypothetical protein